MNFCSVYILSCWQESIENEIEIKARNLQKIQASVIGCGRSTAQIDFSILLTGSNLFKSRIT